VKNQLLGVCITLCCVHVCDMPEYSDGHLASYDSNVKIWLQKSNNVERLLARHNTGVKVWNCSRYIHSN